MARPQRRAKSRADGVKQFAAGIQDVDDVEDPVKILVYARNGVGKTRFAGTAPKPLIIDIDEKGTRSIRGSGAKVRRISTWEDVGYAYWFLRLAKHPYQTVALDTITAMNSVCLNYVLGEAEERDPNRETSSPDKRAYGRAGKLMGAQLLAFRNLPMHVIFLAQERVITDDETGEPILHTPDLPNSSRGVAMGSVGIIGRLYQREVKGKGKKSRWEDRLLVGPHEEYDTKDRSFGLGTVLRNPTMSKVIAAWDARPEDDEEED
jgi:hypothetical protein